MAIETLVLQAAKAAASRVAGPALTGASALAAKHRLRSVAHPATSAATAEEIAGGLLPLDAHQIMTYLGSPEFEELAFQLALNAATDNPRREQRAVEQVRQQLLVHLRQRTNFDEDKRGEIAGLLLDYLNQAIAVHVSRNVWDQKVNGQVFARHILASGHLAAAQVRNTDLLSEIGTLSQIYEFSDQMRSHVRRAHDRIEIQHIKSRQRVAYSQLWVKPFLGYGASVEETRDFGSSGSSAPSRFPGDLPDARSVLVPEDLFRLLRCVVLGDPGAGKSTLASWFAYAVAGDEIPGLTGRVPFLLVLRDYSAVLADPAFSLVDHITGLCRVRYYSQPPEHAVEYLLRNGRAFVVLDGLDELVSPALRTKAVRLVEGFCEEYPTVPVLVTARRVGYQEAALDRDTFHIASLAPFTDDQVGEYVSKWFRLDDGMSAVNLVEPTAVATASPVASPDTRHPLADAFMRESSTIADLRSNPLLLALLCALYRWEGYLPENRPKVYAECTDLLISRWDSLRGIAAEFPRSDSLRGVLAEVAWWMWSDRSVQDSGVTSYALESKVTDYLARTRFDNNRDAAEDAARRFVNFCSGRAWVLTEVGARSGTEIYAFTHRTFLEYFAALYLVRTWREPGQLLAAIINQVISDSTAIVAELAVHEMDVQTGAGSALLDMLMDLTLGSSVAESKKIIGFAARCLAFVSPRESIIRRIIDAAADLSCSAVASDGKAWSRASAGPRVLSFCDEPLNTILGTTSRDNREFVTAQLMRHLTDLLYRAESLDPTTTQNENIVALVDALVNLESKRFLQESQDGQTAVGSLNIEARLRSISPSFSWASTHLLTSGAQAADEAFDLHGALILFEEPVLEFFDRVWRGRSAAFCLADVLIGGSERNPCKIRVNKPDAIVGKLLAQPRPWLSQQDLPSPGIDITDILDQLLLSGGSADQGVWNLALLISLPLMEQGLAKTGREYSRINKVTAPKWLANAKKRIRPGELALSYVETLTEHGLLESCRLTVIKWLRQEISFLSQDRGARPEFSIVQSDRFTLVELESRNE